MLARYPLALVLGAAVLGGCGSSEVSETDIAPLTEWIRANGSPPAAFVTGLFDHHDVVLLGEYQRIARDARFVGELVPALHEAGVTALAIEYACAEDQAVIDSLLAVRLFDEDAVRAVVRRYNGGIWPYQEYHDIFREVWDLNRHLGPGAERMRLVALHPYVDWEVVNGEEGPDRDAELRALAAADASMAARVQAEVRAGRKVLVYCATRRALTDFTPPVVREGEIVRRDENGLGARLHAGMGERVATVLLHQPFLDPEGDDLVSPFEGRLNAALAAHADSVAFATDEGPVAALEETRARLAVGQESLRLSDLCDGWVYFQPFADMRGATVTGWITSENDFEAAVRAFPDRRRARDFDERSDLYDALRADAAIRIKFRDVR